MPRRAIRIWPGCARKATNLRKIDCYLAPHYSGGLIVDDALVEIAMRRKPRHVVVCLGGGTQERVGLMLKRECDFRPSIHCIGAAIGFLTGNPSSDSDVGRQIFSRLAVSVFFGAAKIRATLLESLPTRADDDPLSGKSAEDVPAGSVG